MPIHQTAVIHRDAQLAADVVVGPYAIIEAGAVISEGCKILGHAYVGPGTELGPGSEVHMHAVVGHDPQDLAWAGEPSKVVIGERTILREFVSVHRASRPGSVTRVGDDCLLMVGAHVAHDCCVEDGVVMANHCSLAGHAHVGAGVPVGQRAGAPVLSRRQTGDARRGCGSSPGHPSLHALDRGSRDDTRRQCGRFASSRSGFRPQAGHSGCPQGALPEWPDDSRGEGNSSTEPDR